MEQQFVIINIMVPNLIIWLKVNPLSLSMSNLHRKLLFPVPCIMIVEGNKRQLATCWSCRPFTSAEDVWFVGSWLRKTITQKCAIIGQFAWSCASPLACTCLFIQYCPGRWYVHLIAELSATQFSFCRNGVFMLVFSCEYWSLFFLSFLFLFLFIFGNFTENP